MTTENQLEILLLADAERKVHGELREHMREAGYRLRIFLVPGELASFVASGGGDAILLSIAHCPEPCALVTELRKATTKPILLLHTPDEASIALDLMDLGASDLVCRDIEDGDPIAFRELRTRLGTALRQAAYPEHTDGELVVVADVTLDAGSRTVKRGEHTIDLTRTEYQILHRLMVAAGEIVSHEDLLRGVWSEGQLDRRDYLRTYMSRLRRQLGWSGDASHGPRIRSVRGRGYRIELESSAEDAAGA